MSEERPESPKLRLFVALDLPEETRAGLQDWGRTALADPALRALPAESLHITLAFLGERPESDVEKVVACVRDCRVPAPTIELLDPVARPSRGRPRLFALPVRSPEVERLQVHLREKLVGERLYRPEERPFWPHLTVARVRSQGRGSKQPLQVVERPGKVPESPWRTCVRIVRVGVYRSELNSQGAKYTPLAQIELPRGRQ